MGIRFADAFRSMVWISWLKETCVFVAPGENIISRTGDTLGFLDAETCIIWWNGWPALKYLDTPASASAS
ncbi:MAG: hypothetical protein A4E63_01016 [Syntrophorhabdus sp. PtaU1.Bin050]|nr:MAG: hypothetical protein A4E63_01016 [Syntrophorhabdus sp. PtaU1.Bin050]